MGLIARQALLMAAKDTRVFFKDKFAVGFAFLFPFLFVIGFSFALGDIGPSDDPRELAITTQETDAFSMSGVIIQVLTQGGQSQDQPPMGGMRVVALDYQDALAAVEDESLDGFVSFPPDFSERFTQPSPTALEVVTSGSADPDTQAALRGLATRLAGSLSEVGVIGAVVSELEVKFNQVDWDSVEIYMMQPFDPSVTLEIETVGEIESVGASNFTLPAYLTMFVFFAAALSAEAIARERQGQTLETPAIQRRAAGVDHPGKVRWHRIQGAAAARGPVDGRDSGVQDRPGSLPCCSYPHFRSDGADVSGVRGDARELRCRDQGRLDGRGAGISHPRANRADAGGRCS